MSLSLHVINVAIWESDWVDAIRSSRTETYPEGCWDDRETSHGEATIWRSHQISSHLGTTVNQNIGHTKVNLSCVPKKEDYKSTAARKVKNLINNIDMFSYLTDLAEGQM